MMSGGSSPAAMSRMQVHHTSAAVSVIGSVLIAVGRLFEPLGDPALDLLGEHQAPYALLADRFAVLPRSIWKAENVDHVWELTSPSISHGQPRRPRRGTLALSIFLTATRNREPSARVRSPTANAPRLRGVPGRGGGIRQGNED